MSILLAGGWRVLVASMIIIAPLYGWVIFYYLATGAWRQSIDTVRMGAPILATFIVPLVVGAWIMGFRRWLLAISVVLTVVIAVLLPGPTIANQLLPNSYVNLAVVLILLMIAFRVFHYWREYIVLALPISRYTTGAYVLMAVTIAGLLTLLTRSPI